MLLEYFIIDDQFLWFVTMMNHSLVNTNQVRAFDIQVHDHPFDAKVLRIEADEYFITFTSKVEVISFDLQFPTAW